MKERLFSVKYLNVFIDLMLAGCDGTAFPSRPVPSTPLLAVIPLKVQGILSIALHFPKLTAFCSQGTKNSFKLFA
jgi:hypothetical protein